jgi:hypothetical protein
VVAIRSSPPSWYSRRSPPGPIKVVLGIGGATGVAAFSGLSVNTAGTYTLRASSGTLAGTQSAAFDLTP